MALKFADLNEKAVYLDTTAFYQLLRGLSADAVALFDAIENERVAAYSSVLAFDEVAYRMVLALIRDKYDKSPLDRLRQSKRQMMTEFYPQVESRLRLFYGLPHLTVLPVTSGDLDAMHHNIRQYGCLPRDALHLAAMQKVGCLHLVSQDSDFDHIPGITRYTLD